MTIDYVLDVSFHYSCSGLARLVLHPQKYD
jgi:hypothetical protein